jgi:8-oxo-dGTP pyrophosphatase MutT (NUDIX family)
MPNFEDSYVVRLRKLAGSRKLILAGPRAAATDDQGRLLLIRRSDNHEWAMPAGTMELEESVYGALQREVKEETGLDVLSATLFAIYSDPRFGGVDGWGNHFRHLILAFRVDEWASTLLTVTDETVDARFFHMDALPDLADH